MNSSYKINVLHSSLSLKNYNLLMDFFQDNLGKPAPEKQNHSGKTNLDLLEQEIVSGSGISRAICKSAPRPRQIIMPASHHSSFFTGWMPFLLPNQQHQSTVVSLRKGIPHFSPVNWQTSSS